MSNTSQPGSDAAALTGPELKWYQGLDRYCWVVLIVAALGWLLDTMDQSLFNLVRMPSIKDLLRASYPDDPQGLTLAAKAHAGYATAWFIVGWATGGFLFGILGDRIGRTRTLVLTILLYAVFTGVSGLATSIWFYDVARFLTGLGVGGEWAAGAALVAETFPARSRPMALGLLQALSTVGNMTAAVITLAIGDMETGRFDALGYSWSGWRLAFLIGALPALLVVWIRRSVKEPPAWEEQKRLHPSREMGNILELFRHPLLRRHVSVGLLLATAGVGALWGVANFSTDLLDTRLRAQGAGPAEIGRFKSLMFLLQQAGAFFGLYLFAVVAERLGRRRAFMGGFVLTFLTITGFFWIVEYATHTRTVALMLAPLLGFGMLAPFSGLAIYLPELFPTRLRTTGCGFCYNAARYLAAGAPFALGGLAGQLGYAAAATLVSSILLLGLVGAWLGPETRGRPLPQ
jgi:MFS family permease